MSRAHTTPVIIHETASNGARLLQFRGGDSIASTASSIAFLWSNWDSLFKLAKSPFYAVKQAEGIWRGGGYGASGEWYFSAPPSIGVDEGRFEFFSSLRFLGTPVRGRPVFEYRRVGTQRFAYSGRSWGELPPRLSLLRWLIEPLGNIATSKFNSIGGGTAERITLEPSLVQSCCDADTYSRFLAMIEEENAALSGVNTTLHAFRPHSRPDGSLHNDPLGSLRRDFDALEQKLQARLHNIDLSEYKRSLDLFISDPDSAVVKCRKILEPIVLTVFKTEFRGRPPRLTINDRIKELTYNSSNIPNGITALMHTVNNLGNIGAHFAEGKVPNVIDLAQFKTSFSALLGIADWFYHSGYSINSDAHRGTEPSS